MFTPSCYNGQLPGTAKDPTRTFCCDARSPDCLPQYEAPETPVHELPSYTGDNRRDHHHVIDGPIVGNGNIGVAAGSGNLWNASAPWLDLYISTNSFWATSSTNHTSGQY